MQKSKFAQTPPISSPTEFHFVGHFSYGLLPRWKTAILDFRVRNDERRAESGEQMVVVIRGAGVKK